MRSSPARFGLSIALVIAVLTGMGAAAGASSGITIGTVGGQNVVDGTVRNTLSGNVSVTGTASTSAGAPGPAAQPLVADAGDSPWVESGEQATLLGSGYGGSAPYTFQWSASAGTLTGADSATALLDTTGLAPGLYGVGLTITDAAGASASDTVKVAVYEARSETVLDETKADGTPGTVVTGETVEFPFTVPDGARKLDVALSWGNPINDYDLEVYDPDGTERDSSGNPAGEFEEVHIPNPAPGEWKVVAIKWATVPDDVHALATVEIAEDPRPAVSSGGPYAFATGAPQSLDGTVTGGTAPVAAGWDTDEDGVIDKEGTDVGTNLSDGRHIVTLKATDAQGLERRETTTVLVADPARLAQETTPMTVIGVADTGINPYHLEFSAETYPDPDVLALTESFTRHPSQYIPGYPANATALPVTFGKGYFPPEDEAIWEGNTTIKAGELYWVPGTKIIGAIDAGGSTGATSGEDSHPILDDNGHGSGSASVSTGNRYGYCPTCLLVVVEALDESVVAALPWVDISSNSFGYVGGAPVGPIVGPSESTRAAAERGQTTLFAAGNGVGNAFDVPISTYGSDQTGPDWNVTVGAIRRDNERAIVGDGIPVHISAWGDGNLPSACRTGTVGQCAFGGTSAATPYTAGVFGTVLTEVRAAVGDGQAGQKPGQVVARGVPLDESVYLQDGALTRAELREAVLRTAFPLNTENELSPFPYPATAPYTGDTNVLFEGYGAATPEGGRRAVDVLLGRAQMPERPFEDDFFAIDRSIRDSIYGGYDRDGDGTVDSEALGGLAVTQAQVASYEGAMKVIETAAVLESPDLTQPMGDNPITYYLHRRLAAEPGTDPSNCASTHNEQYMDRTDTAGDKEPCFESRVTSVVAAFRPLGIFASTDTLDAPLPAGSKVNVELFIAGETPSMVRPTGVLVATDREIGTGEGPIRPVMGSGPGGAGCAALQDLCWSRYVFTFETDRHAFTGEQLTFQVQLIGARSWAFGFEGFHASKLSIESAALPGSDLDFGVTISEPADGSSTTETETVTSGGAVDWPDLGSAPGDHPTQRRVEVSVDDDSFAEPVEATIDEESGTWSAPLGELSVGPHTIYARAAMDQTYSEVASSTFTIEASAVVEWQVVRRNSATDDGGWQRADGLGSWSFAFDTAAYDKGRNMIVVRLVEQGFETARAAVRARFK